MQRRKKIFEAGVLKWKANSPAGGLGGAAPQTLTRLLELYGTESLEILRL